MPQVGQADCQGRGEGRAFVEWKHRSLSKKRLNHISRIFLKFTKFYWEIREISKERSTIEFSIIEELTNW